jgi:hypothetical protein
MSKKKSPPTEAEEDIKLNKLSLSIYSAASMTNDSAAK